MTTTDRSSPEIPVAIRRAGPADAAALERLAILDGRGRAFARVVASWAGEPELTVLLAEVDDAAVAAVVVPNGIVFADPFAPTADLVRLLQVRSGQLQVTSGRGFHARAARRLQTLRA